MYTKTKYLLYFALIIFVFFFFLAVSKQSDQKILKETSLISQRNNMSSIVQEQTVENIENQEQNFASVTPDNTTIIENFSESPQQLEIQNIDRAKVLKYYTINSSKFETIYTSSKDFGFIVDLFYKNYYAIAQSLDNDILLYIFSKDGDVKWQTLLKNNDGKKLNVTALSFNGEDLCVKYTQEGSMPTYAELFSVTNENDNISVKHKDSDISQYKLYDRNNNLKNGYTPLGKFTFDNTTFWAVVYYDLLNTPKYAKYVNKNFYLYKEDNGVLIYHSLLFSRVLPKDDPYLFEALDAYEDSNKVTITFSNDRQNATKTIYKSYLTGKYAKLDFTKQLYVKTRNSSVISNIDINVRPVYE